MENTNVFTIKYLETTPTCIDIRYLPHSYYGPRPPTNVSHLISATQHVLPNQLGQSDINELSLHLSLASPALQLDTLLETIQSNTTLIIKSTRNVTLRISDFLSNTLEDIERPPLNKTTTGTKRNHPKVPKNVGRWENFLSDAASYDYPTTPIKKDITLPATRRVRVQLERDIDRVIGNHLDNFNRIFKDQGINCCFESKSASSHSELENRIEIPCKFYGVPDNVLTLDSKVLSFIEDKTANDLPVRHSITGLPFDLLHIYKEDIENEQLDRTRPDLGRTDVCHLIDQVYGYMALNNLIYGCVTCYEVTYFLTRPARGTLLISHPIYNKSTVPTLLQALYYFSNLALKGHEEEQQTLDPSPKDTDMPIIIVNDPPSHIEASDEVASNEQSESGSNYSSGSQSKGMKYTLNRDSLHTGTFVGQGATGQVIKVKGSDIVLKCCDSYNNSDGYKMFENEILVYEKLSKLDLSYVPRYYGACELYGQHFIALEYIPGIHCDWRADGSLMNELDIVLRDLESVGVVHNDLKPENVLLTREGNIKLIDFGKAEIREIKSC